MPLNRWDGSSWVDVPKSAFAWWDGSAWQEPSAGYWWDGSSWQPIWPGVLSGDDVAQGNHSQDGLYGIDGGDGVTIWFHDFGVNSPDISLDVMGDKIFVGLGTDLRRMSLAGDVEQLYTLSRGSCSGFYTALDSDPARSWIFIAFKSGDGGVGAYEEDVDVLGNPVLTEHWHTHSNNEVGQSCSFDATNDKVFFANDGANELWRLAAGTGTLEATVALPATPWNVEATQNSEVYVSLHNDEVRKFDVDLNEDTTGWPFALPDVPDSLITDDTYIYIGTRGARTYKVDRSGTEQWSAVIGSGVRLDARVNDLRVYPSTGNVIVSHGEGLTLLDAAGNDLWVAADPGFGVGVTTLHGRHNSGKGW